MKIGDYVVRKKYNQDILFEIINIEGNQCILRGVELRLVADSIMDDLILCDERKDEESLFYLDNDNILKGKVLHLDGDESYLKLCEKKYKELGIYSICCHVLEKDMRDQVIPLLELYKPNILVLTGHDALRKNKDEYNVYSYQHSYDYNEAIKNARLYEKDKDRLIIIAGACQSYYELLLASGANFASSPKRKNIHALDPVLIASQVASASVKQYCDIKDIISHTIHRDEGMGGIDTKGTARKIYP